ncbi:tRNA methyltransferase complex GCD14 subunit [Metarhizium rileyi]|uniref:tRNA (adenine(58)-N(1))-methyltransferase catalytic subunit TRM61 n=1 Tax=Metarhizium rileyi (strain RCEF 4871) TaxID=1649241 RepID=A0A167CXH9_METRR|nr:tRNA methyltransferase complex GCD14 subunit [Metarhizium rileyi RCEF 4871]TWU73425.1 tRNA (adenine-N(1)-)-methyltransferase catalytic subunit trm61 [Metarhizium rileyi]
MAKSSTNVRPSPFLQPTSKTSPNTLAIISLSKENFQPITLQESAGAVDGYAEGATLNTRFGSFPHSTLLDIPWGSQVRASVVDTGSRGRKRRRDEVEDQGTATPISNQDDGNDTPTSAPTKKAVVASSGFIYVLRPTPELWTSSLPHRTQVVYTPDYSYVLQRIRARPGTRIIEAGAGSGSFTHASARAVYSGYPKSDADVRGKVFSFEFHEPRFQKMEAEIKQHLLEGIVQVTHRDVCEGGFLINGKSPKVSAIFLDVPAPWEALHHLARRKTHKGGKLDENPGDWESPLDPNKSAYICTFSPCIEQVTRTVTEMRTLGWTGIDMIEIAHRRFNVMRDRAGVNIPNEKGFSAQPADVMEAVKKLKSDLKRTRDFHKAQLSQLVSDASESKMDVDESTPESCTTEPNKNEDPWWLQGRVVHRTENDIKTHTSYLVFAVLPREWDEAAEEAAMAKWPCGSESKTIGNLDKQARKQEKRELMAGKKHKKQRSNDTQQTTQ